MASKLDIANLAMTKLGSTHVFQLDPPKTSNERLMALLLPSWTDAEIRRHNWHFARTVVTMPLLADPSGSDDQPYAYQIPANVLRIVRQQGDTWTKMGGQLWSELDDGLSVLALVRPVDTALYDALFIPVLVARLAYEACEQITQSNQKKQDAAGAYKDALDEAKKANAYERFPDDIAADDGSFSWLSVRDNGLSGYL